MAGALPAELHPRVGFPEEESHVYEGDSATICNLTRFFLTVFFKMISLDARHCWK